MQHQRDTGEVEVEIDVLAGEMSVVTKVCVNRATAEKIVQVWKRSVPSHRLP